MARTNYKSAGVDYSVLDPAKQLALSRASQTSIKHPDAEALMHSRGASAFVFRANDSTFATVLECLGTKSVVAREYINAGGADLFANVGYDAVASIVNDLVSVGAIPLVINAYFATGSAEWYENSERYARLIEGWGDACLESGAAWGGGESPTLSGLVNKDDIEIAGSAVGFFPPGQQPVLGEELGATDEIVFIASTGLHANGASLVRKTVGRLSDGYRTLLPSGREFGEAVLDRSALYVRLVSELDRQCVPVTYYSHITGHGLRKLMRANTELTYRITSLDLPVPDVLDKIRELTKMSVYTAYGTLNMGIGFAVFCEAGHGDQVVAIAQELGYSACVAGHVEEGPTQVILEPLNVTFGRDQLQIRHTPPRKD